MRKTVWIEKLDNGYSVRYYTPSPTDPKKYDKPREWFETFTEANNRKTTLRATLQAQKQNLPDPHLKTQVVYDAYINAIRETRRAATLLSKYNNLKQFIASNPDWAKISDDSITKYKTYLGKYSVSTISTRLRAVKTFLKWAGHNGYQVQKDLFEGISIPAITERGTCLEIEELKAILANSDPKALAYFQLKIYTGCRGGELTNALWGEFDLNTGVWNIPSHHAKSKRQRSVPLDPICVETLKASPRTGPRVFEGWHHRSGGYYLRKACKKAGIIRRIMPHDLRHTFVSRWKADPRILADMIGWKNLTMLKRYSHFNLDRIRQAATAGSVAADLSKVA